MRHCDVVVSVVRLSDGSREVYQRWEYASRLMTLVRMSEAAVEGSSDKVVGVLQAVVERQADVREDEAAKSDN